MESMTNAPQKPGAQENEEAQKSFPIVNADKTLAYAIAGFITLDDFCVLDDVKKKTSWLSKRAFSTCKKYFTVVAEEVTEEINEAKHANRIKTFPASRKSETGTSWKIADLILAGYYAGVPSLGIAQITHTDGTVAECDVNFYDPITHSS
jgi:hypothetical protein